MVTVPNFTEEELNYIIGNLLADEIDIVKMESNLKIDLNYGNHEPDVPIVQYIEEAQKNLALVKSILYKLGYGTTEQINTEVKGIKIQ